MNYFAVAVFLDLWLLQTASAIEIHNDINAIVYIDNGTESADLSCGKVPENATAIEWFLQNSEEWEMILKFKHMTPGSVPQNIVTYKRDKYGITDSVHTSLVIKNIDISDIGLFQCITKGTDMAYTYTTLLKVVGKFLLQYYI